MAEAEHIKKKARTDAGLAPTLTLNNGDKMPILGLGTWKSKPGQVETAVKAAIDVGYRHIDCAAVYGNEKEVGAALKEKIDSGAVKREDLWITSKLWNTKHKPEDVLPAIKETLADLGLAYLDLYLVHWPVGFQAGDNKFPKDAEGNVLYDNTPLMDTWQAMEKLVDAGLAKAIGVSNYNSEQVAELCDKGRIKPAVNQVEVHPYLNQKELIAFCKDKGVAITAYSPLGSPDRPWAKDGEPLLLEDPKMKAIGEKQVPPKSPAQVAIRFQIERGVIVIPKSVTPSRIKDNFDVLDFTLTADDIKTVEGFNVPFRACVPKVEVDGKSVARDSAHPNYPFNIPF